MKTLTDLDIARICYEVCKRHREVRGCPKKFDPHCSDIGCGSKGSEIRELWLRNVRNMSHKERAKTVAFLTTLSNSNSIHDIVDNVMLEKVKNPYRGPNGN